MKPAGIALALAASLLAADPARAQVDDWTKLRFPPAKAPSFPKPSVFKLKNGLNVFLLEDHELPLVRANVMARTGTYDEPAGKVGLAGIASGVMRSGGSDSMKGDALDDFLAARAASIEISVGAESGSASMDCLKADFDDVFKAFADLLRHPAFPQDKLDLAKVQANSAIARRNDNVQQITSREIAKLVYGPDSPWARTAEYATIAAIGRDDLVAWHARVFVPGSLYLGLVGDFDSKEIRKKLEATLGEWPKGAAPQAPLAGWRESPAPGVYFIEKSDVTQANIAMAHLGIDRKNPDWFAVQVMNEVLSGGFGARMFSNIRSKKGLAYSVSGSLGASFAHPGLFQAGLQTKSSTMAVAVDALREEIRGIIDRPPSADELTKAKESLLNSFVFNYDSSSKILSQQMTFAFFGLAPDFLEQYPARIAKITGEDVTRVARQYVHPDALAILVVGKSAEFERPVDTLGKVTTLDIAIPRPGATAAATTPAAPTAPSVGDRAAGRKALARAATTMGGKDAARVKAIRQTATVTLSMAGQSMALQKTETLVFPDRLHQTIQTPMGEQTIVIDGKSAFAVAGGAVRDVPQMADEAAKELGRDLRMIIRYAEDPALTTAATGVETIDGAACDVVTVQFRGSDARLWIDPQGHIVQEAFDGENPLTRVPGKIRIRYSDWRDEGGRQVPHRQVVKVDDQEVVSSTLVSWEVDPAVSDSLFKKPGE